MHCSCLVMILFYCFLPSFLISQLLFERIHTAVQVAVKRSRTGPKWSKFDQCQRSFFLIIWKKNLKNCYEDQKFSVHGIRVLTLGQYQNGQWCKNYVYYVLQFTLFILPRLKLHLVTNHFGRGVFVCIFLVYKIPTSCSLYH